MDKKSKLRILKWAIILWALVGLFILVTFGLIQGIYNMGGLCCASNPVNSVFTGLARASSGTGTEIKVPDLCLAEDEDFSLKPEIDKVAMLNSVTFDCQGSSCGKIRITNRTYVKALESIKFNAQMSCNKRENGGYDCNILILEGNDCSRPNKSGESAVNLALWIVGLIALLIVYRVFNRFK